MRKSALTFKTLYVLLLAVLLLPLGLTDIASGQRRPYGNSSSVILGAGTTINVRTTEEIEAEESDGRNYLGVVDQDVTDGNGNVSIPRGSDVELVVRNISDNELAIDLNTITVNGRRFGVDTQGTTVTSEKKKGLGVNKRTGKYVGGGAVLGAIIGGITGGGKGAAIGAGAGAAAGAGVQVLTRGRKVSIPAETLLTFQLQQPLRTTGNGFTRSEQRYRSDYDRPAYGRASIDIGNDNRVRWQAPEVVRVYVQVDNNPWQLFAEGQSGTQYARWITPGHTYLFVVRDLNGNELSRDRRDLR